jgi:hypothetical protein
VILHNIYALSIEQQHIYLEARENVGSIDEGGACKFEGDVALDLRRAVSCIATKKAKRHPISARSSLPINGSSYQNSEVKRAEAGVV